MHTIIINLRQILFSRPKEVSNEVSAYIVFAVDLSLFLPLISDSTQLPLTPIPGLSGTSDFRDFYTHTHTHTCNTLI